MVTMASSKRLVHQQQKQQQQQQQQSNDSATSALQIPDLSSTKSHTPRKRKADMHHSAPLSAPVKAQRQAAQLIDARGRASISLMAGGPSTSANGLLDHDGYMAIASSILHIDEDNDADEQHNNNDTPRARPTSDLLVAFDLDSVPYSDERTDESDSSQSSLSHFFSSPSTASSSSPSMLAKMIPVEMPSMGRMIVHRSEVLHFPGLIPVARATRPSSDSQSTSSSSVGSSAGLSVESSATTNTTVTQATNTDEDKDGTSKQTSAARVASNAADLLHVMRAATTSLARRPTGLPLHLRDQDGAVCKPRLDGLGMPTLDWPDTTNGPWADAGKPSESARKQKRLAIARWLDEESDDDKPAKDMYGHLQHQQQHYPQHPMVAKAVMDRKRKEDTIRALAFASLTSLTPFEEARSGGRSKRRRNHDASTPASKVKGRKIRRRKGGAVPGTTPRLPVDDLHVSTPSRHNDIGGLAQIGCQCGRTDDGTPMIQCDECNMWYHMACVGLPTSCGTGVLGEEWFCYMCYATMSSSLLTPSSAATLSSSGTGGLVVTPNFPRSAALQHSRLSQGQLPVFSQPLDTPFHQQRRDDGHAHVFSSGIALAPSPVMLSGSSLENTARQNRHAPGGRSRASRTGWHMTEPGSPLDRKSTVARHRRNLSATGTAVLGGGKVSTGLGPSGSNGSSHHQQSHEECSTPRAYSTAVDQMSAYLRTPSPRLVSAGTPTQPRARMPSNAAMGGRSSGFAASSDGRHARESSAMRDFDDVFSTPSRFMHLSSGWGQLPSSASTATATAVRRTREDSVLSINGSATANGAAQQHHQHGLPWGLSTPTRHLMDIGFGSDYSGAAGGLPSLVHSSGGLEMGEFAGWQHLQNSPTSSTRAAVRARQQSSSGVNARRMETSSMREREHTPEHVGTASSSSPFPKTPTFLMEPFYPSTVAGATSHHHGRVHGGGGGLSPGMPSSSPSTASHARAFAAGRLAKQHNGSAGNTDSLLHSLQAPLELSNAAARKDGVGASSGAAASQQQQQQQQQLGVRARARNASTDLMAGLGIGLDLNDVIDWT